jgi:diaminopimelate epimerase
MTGIPFIKMHGAGNDFVVFDGRRRSLALVPAVVRAIADRRLGVGCDQVIVIEPAGDGSGDDTATARMRIFNADGGEVGACGNASRCVADLLMRESGADHLVIETAAGRLEARREAAGISVDMGPAGLDWRQIPLVAAADTLALDLTVGPLRAPVAVNVGNPHAVFFVANPDAVDLEREGPRVENHEMFPEGTNVGLARVDSRTSLRLRVWERGVGITPACGTAACAAVVAAHRRGLTDRAVEVVLDGGKLAVEWLANDHLHLIGPVARVFAGELDPAIIGSGLIEPAAGENA